jgi:hypothetical protein
MDAPQPLGPEKLNENPASEEHSGNKTTRTFTDSNREAAKTKRPRHSHDDDEDDEDDDDEDDDDDFDVPWFFGFEPTQL